MRIFLAGATGAIGQSLVPLLIDAGHEVTGMTRSAGQGRRGSAPPAPTPAIADGLDRDAVDRRGHRRAAGRDRAPAHGLTGIANLRNFDGAFALTNRLRTEGTDNLLAGARGRRREPLRRAVLRRLAVRAHRRAGQDRGRPARPRPRAVDARDARRDPPRRARDAAGGRSGAALRRRSTARARAWRPAASSSPPSASASSRSSATAAASGRSCTSTTRPRRRSPRSSAARPASTTSSTTTPRPRASGCRCWPRRPAPSRRATCRAGSARLAAGEAVVALMTEIRGASNAKAKRELGWRPAYPSWREGFADSLRSGATRGRLARERALEDRLQRVALVLPGDGLLQPQPARAARRARGSRPGCRRTGPRARSASAPADRRRPRRAPAACPTSVPARLHAKRIERALAVVERVAERRAGRLVDRRAHPGAAREPDLGQVGVVHVARQRDDRRRRRAVRARRRRAHELHDAVERGAERRPVLEVERLPDLLAQQRRRLAPGAVADRLVPGLQVVQARARAGTAATCRAAGGRTRRRRAPRASPTRPGRASSGPPAGRAPGRRASRS